jgi:hypothetical protein
MEVIKKNQICEYELLKSNIVFVDGLTRVGKAMYNRIIASLQDMTQPQFLELLEQLLPMYKTGHIDKNAFSAFLRLHLNERAYNYNLSRNLNFRYDDLTSIYNANNFKKLFKNLSKNDGDEIVEELLNDKMIHQFQTHDVLTDYSLFLDLNLGVKIIEVIRNPVDTIHSWYKRGWGKRFDQEDPRNFTCLFKNNGKTLPYYALGYEEKYFTLNEMEKCIFLHNKLLNQSIQEYNQISNNQKENILILRYEDMLNNPEIEIDKICLFLNTKKTEYTQKAMIDARVPRVTVDTDRKNKLDDIRKQANKELFDELTELTHIYENKIMEW